MAKNVKNLKSTKRFGTRYGKSLKLKVAEFESSQRGTHKCPYCSYTKANRVSTGIWLCDKCKSKFTGKAYSLSRKKASKVEEDMELLEEAPEEKTDDEEFEDNEETDKETESEEDIKDEASEIITEEKSDKKEGEEK